MIIILFIGLLILLHTCVEDQITFIYYFIYAIIYNIIIVPTYTCKTFINV